MQAPSRSSDPFSDENFAASEVNELDKAAKLARVQEERVRRDPNSTDEDIAAAKETRKTCLLYTSRCV